MEFVGPHKVLDAAITDDNKQVRLTLREVKGAPAGAGEREARKAYGDNSRGMVIVRMPAETWHKSGPKLGDVVRLSASVLVMANGKRPPGTQSARTRKTR